ncbi:hypothetical protein LCGC14_1658410 [marine sediment metagenome]|uniref:Uncharacterized protein n=1 Tax=marine sediment metagenome TaxID=412755 RepID=A0A0F9IHC1_9ZZZZ
MSFKEHVALVIKISAAVVGYLAFLYVVFEVLT